MATPSRNVRVADPLWTDAKAVLAGRGTTVSAFLVGKLTELVEADRAHKAWAEGLGKGGAAAVDSVDARREGLAP